METGGRYKINIWLHCCIGLLFLMMMQARLAAQQQAGSYSIRNGKMFITIKKHSTASDIEKFIRQYNLTDLPLKEFIKTGISDSLKKLGWTINKNDKESFTISKSMTAFNDINDPAHKIVFSEKHPTFAEMFPSVNNGLAYGYNRFRNKPSFAVNNSTVTFFLRGYTNAHRVILAGSFNDWSVTKQPMTKTENGWIINVQLSAGKYWYKFIVDGNWMDDEDNMLKENDGLGNINSVYFKPNVIFKLGGFADAKKVFVAGSFNNWNKKELAMMKTSKGWELPVYLAEGTHTYKFVVDGQWHAEDKKVAQLPDGEGGYNSVMEIGKPHIFKLTGYTNAKQVVLSGSFNGWRTNELYMAKTANGWQLPYVIGAGNYEYKFLVDGHWITDPANPLIVNNENGIRNSYLIIDANYTFRLKGYGKAGSVFLAGDFNNWSPQTLRMIKDGDDWIFSVHLSAGKHQYKFIVDGEWIIDPANKLWEQNEYGTGNSIIWIDK
ncbi:MAG: hypothetical protein JO072_11140 [Parafilimonas sp.]|nr:hypothetical protein [Parafilimonas sp.]